VHFATSTVKPNEDTADNANDKSNKERVSLLSVYLHGDALLPFFAAQVEVCAINCLSGGAT
jgi:hypothetical protein